MADQPNEAADLAKESGDNLDIMNNLIDGKGETTTPPVDEEVGETDVEEPPTETQEEETQELSDEEEIAQELETEEDEEIGDLGEEEEFTDQPPQEKAPRSEPPLLRPLQKKYPDIFKGEEGRQLRTKLFREHLFSQQFNTVEEAKSAAERLEDANFFEQKIVEGDAETFVKTVGQTNKESLHKFVDNFLPALYKEDKEAYGKVTHKIVASALTLAMRQGQSALKSGDETRGKNLVNSVRHLAALIWPGHEGNIPELAEEKEDPRVEAKLKELNEREQRDLEVKSNQFNGEVRSVGIKLVRKKILNGLDPNNALPEFVRDSIVDKTLREVGRLMDEDPLHVRSMQRLWSTASRSGFSNEVKSKLIGTYLGRASQLVGPIRRKFLLQATGKAPVVGSNKSAPPIRKPIPAGGTRAVGTAGRVPNAKDIDWNKTSPLDLMAGKVTTKKKA